MAPTRAGQVSGRNAAATNRAASVPVSRPENSRLESLRLKKPTLPVSNDGGPLPASLPNIVTTRGRKRACSPFCSTGCMASTSALTTAALNANEQRPQKRQKRSLSTPATSRATQPQTHRRSRSRVGSPTTDVEYALPSRRSTRIARRFHSFINTRNPDIYTHLAGPGGAGSLLGEPPTSSVMLPTPNGMVGSQLVHKPRGRRRKAVDLANESAKKDLMEEWARMRQSQGTLPPARIDENASFSQVHMRDTRNVDGSLHLGAITQERSPEVHTLQTQRTIPDDSRRDSSPKCMDSENTFSLGTDGKKMDHTDLTLPSEDRTTQMVALVPNLHVGKGFSNGELACTPEIHNPDLLHYPVPPLTSPVSRSRGDSDVTKLPISEQAEAVNLDSLSKGNHLITVSQTCSIEKSSICLDFDEEFCMLDIPEIFTLPWEPVSSHLYVPPSLGKLVSGMREQLTIEARARRRAEELYQVELSRRISAEKTIGDLLAELERKDGKTYQQELIGRQQDGAG